MDRYNYFITDVGQKDIEGISLYIKENYYSETALAIVKEIRTKIERICDNPFIYEKRDIFSKYFGHIRIATVKNYNIFFSVNKDKKVVYIVRVAHCTMNLIQEFLDGIN